MTVYRSRPRGHDLRHQRFVPERSATKAELRAEIEQAKVNASLPVKRLPAGKRSSKPRKPSPRLATPAKNAA